MNDQKPAMNPYPKFAAMIATSTLVMFALMYLNTNALDHVFFSQTRAWMALVMGATMVAAPMIGGVVTSAILELLLYPVIYVLWRGHEVRMPADNPQRVQQLSPI